MLVMPVAGPYAACIIVEDPNGPKVKFEVNVEADGTFTGTALVSRPDNPNLMTISVEGDVSEAAGRPMAVVHDAAGGPGGIHGVVVFDVGAAAGYGVGWYDVGGQPGRFRGPAEPCP